MHSFTNYFKSVFVRTKIIYIHIGPDKTGTKTLQTFLRSNQKNLLASHILYPELTDGWSVNHEVLARNLKNDRGTDTSSVWENLFEQIKAKHRINTIILSAEAFYRFNTDEINQIAEKLSNYSVKIIFYARRQDTRIESLYNQASKTITYKPTGTICEFIEAEKHHNDYYKILEPWANTFGSVNIIVKVLESKQIPDLNIDFLNMLNITNIDKFEMIPNRNKKIGFKSIVIHKLLQNVFYPGTVPLKEVITNKYGTEAGKIISRLNHGIQDAISQFAAENMNDICEYRLIPYDDCLNVLEYFSESNRNTARKYLGRDKLFYESPEYYQHHDLNMNPITADEYQELITFLLRDEKMRSVIFKLMSLSDKSLQSL